MSKEYRELVGSGDCIYYRIGPSYQEGVEVTMSGKLQPINRDTACLLSSSLQDWLPEKPLACFEAEQVGYEAKPRQRKTRKPERAGKPVDVSRSRLRLDHGIKTRPGEESSWIQE